MDVIGEQILSARLFNGSSSNKPHQSVPTGAENPNTEINIPAANAAMAGDGATIPTAAFQTGVESPTSDVSLQRQAFAQDATSGRPVDRNWARVRQKMIGEPRSSSGSPNSQGTDLPRYSVDPNYTLFSDPKTPTQPSQNTNSSVGSSIPAPLSLITSSDSTLKQSLGGTVHLDPPLPLSTGIRGVLGFRTVVLQRTQLRKMEKEIEKLIARFNNEVAQPRMRTTAARIGTGTRGMLPGASYNIVVAEPSSVERAFLDDVSDVLTRWKSLTVEVPCRTEIFRIFSRMMLAQKPDPLSAADAKLVLNLFEQMRQQYPLQSDPEDLHDVLWILSLLGSKYICNKERVMTLVTNMLSMKNLAATIPLLPKNMHALLASIIQLQCEQDNLPPPSRDPRIQQLLSDLIKRLRGGDLGVGTEKDIKDRPLQEHIAQVAFLRTLFEFLRLKDYDLLYYLLHEVIPKYWVEPSPLYPFSLDGPVRVLGQTTSDFILHAPVAFADCSDKVKSIILDFTVFIHELLPPAGLQDIASKDAMKAIVRFTLTVLSVEYLEVSPPAKDEEDATLENALGSVSEEFEREYASRTPPRSPLSPNVSRENFQSRTLPSNHQSMSPDEATNPIVQRARAYLNALWNSGHQNLITGQLLAEMESLSFRRLVNLYHRVIFGSPKAMATPLLAKTLSTLFSKLVSHQPESSEQLSRLLLQLSIHYRALFFKPMIACVASDSAQFVTEYLCVLSCLEMHLRLVDLYMKDADMICVIMMTDVGPERPRTEEQNPGLKWGSCTVGQCVIIIEFIYAIKRLARSGEHRDVEIGKMFLIDLERKLGMYLVAKEKKVLVPRAIRVLLCQMFYEIRMLCKTIHRPGWLPRILEWTMNHSLPTGKSSTQYGDCGISDTMRLRIKHIYNSVDSQICERPERYTTTTSNPSCTTSTVRMSTLSRNVKLSQAGNGSTIQTVKTVTRLRRMDRLPDIRMYETVAVLMLLVTVQSALHVAEYLKLVSPLWQLYCLETRPKVAASAAFLFVKCADLAPKTIYNLISSDLTSEDASKRLSAVEKLHGLFDHRNVLLMQPYVIDPSARGPFRNLVTQVPFVTTEVGNNRYTMDEPRWLTELKSAGNFPADIRNRFQALGWGDKDQEEAEMTQRSQTPLMLSWTGFLDKDYDAKINFGRTYTVLPKDRHATVLVPVMNALSMKTIDLLEDKTVGVRSAAINFITNYIRNEPVLFVRSFFSEIVQTRPDRQRDLIGRLQLLVSSCSKLPPGFAFSLFNHLLGILKYFQKNPGPLGIDRLTAVLPLLTDVVTSTNDIVFKDFKRNKVDIFFTNLGRFWFKQGLLPKSMFPSMLTEPSPVLRYQMIPHQLFQMALANVGQIQFMTSFLIRFPLEAQDIKCNIGHFSRMPMTETESYRKPSNLELDQFLPDMTKQTVRFIEPSSIKDKSFQSLSSLRARSWLCFILNLLQRMDKQSSEWMELTNLFVGVNSILLQHGDDLGILGQILDVYVTAATRFRRFFALQNGYSLIFPALFKNYCDSKATRVAQETIHAVFYRFYMLHQEAFILQSLGSIAPLILRPMPTEQSEVMAQHLFTFLEALDAPKTTFDTKALGVSSLAERYHQKQSYGGPQLEIPQWMASFIPKGSKLFESNNLLQRNDFTIAESIKLFLAVIVYDPGSLRSEQFVRILTMTLKYFLDREPLLMTDGVDSLVESISKFCRSSKPLVPSTFVPPTVAPRPLNGLDDSRGDISRFALVVDPLSKSQAIKGKSWAQNDRVAIKHEFICLIQYFCRWGGQLADEKHQQMAFILRSLVKDYTSIKVPLTTDWIKEYIQCCILPLHSLHQSSCAVLNFTLQFSGIFKTTFKSVDYSGLLDGLTLVAEDSRRFLRATGELSNVFRDKIVSPGLAFGVKEDWVTESIHVSQSKFCSSLVNLILAMISNADLDTTVELEEATPTPRLIAYVVIPLCLRFETRFRANCLDILEMQFWLRMLGLTIKAAEYDPTRRLSRTAGLFAPVLNAARGTRASRHQVNDFSAFYSGDVGHGARGSPTLAPQTPAAFKMSSLHTKEDRHEYRAQYQSTCSMNASPGLLVDFIALRIIMVRGARYLSYHPGCWLDIFNITKKYFASHAFFLAGGAVKHGRHNSYNESGPASPNPLTPNPSTPRTSAPWTPQPRSSPSNIFSPCKMSSETSGDMTSYPSSVHTVDGEMPMTALGYIFWSFVETIFFNRLPLMIMVRPFLLDQFRQVDSWTHHTFQRQGFRSSNGSGSSSPAFYWPSPAASPADSHSPMIPPPLHRNASTESELAAFKKQQRQERRKQWKSWSKPTEPIGAYTAIDVHVLETTTPMSPNASLSSHHRMHSTFSNSENAGSFKSQLNPQDGAQPMPLPKHHSNSEHRNIRYRGHKHRHDGGHDSRSETVLPAVLVDHANRSMEHVRLMMSSGSDSMTGVDGYSNPGKDPLGANLVPSKTLSNRRESPRFHPTEIASTGEVGSGSDQQFLLPGRYDRQPTSPGFGSMYLAREAALNRTYQSPPPVRVTSQDNQPTKQNRMSLTVPSKSHGPGFSLNQSLDSRPTGLLPAFIESPQPEHRKNRSAQARSSVHPNVLGDPVELSTLAPVSPLSPSTATKKNRGILKPRIITTSPPRTDAIPHIGLSTGKAESPMERHSDPCPSVSKIDNLDTDMACIRSRAHSYKSKPKVSPQDQNDYQVACLQARTKIFLQNIDEETRTVLACFPYAFSLSYTPATDPAPQHSTIVAAAAVSATAISAASAIAASTMSPSARPQQGRTDHESAHGTGQSKEGSNDQGRGPKEIGNSSQHHRRQTPSITIQDQSQIVPSPIHPLPGTFEEDETLLGGYHSRHSNSSGSITGTGSTYEGRGGYDSGSSRICETSGHLSSDGNRSSYSIGSPILLSAPKPKERRSKSVIFTNQLQGQEPPQFNMLSLPSSRHETTAKPAELSGKPSNVKRELPQTTLTAPTFSLTTSSPPLEPILVSSPPLTIGLPPHFQDTLEPRVREFTNKADDDDAAKFPMEALNLQNPDLGDSTAIQEESQGSFAR